MHNLWQTIVQSLQGLNNNGSSKRVTAYTPVGARPVQRINVGALLIPETY